MRQQWVATLLLASGVLLSASVWGQSSFDIRLRLDPSRGVLTGEQSVVLTNTSTGAWESLLFRWGFNASTKRVEEVSDRGGNPLSVRYITPEDTLSEGDVFLFEVALPSPLPSGEETTLRLKFAADGLTPQEDVYLLSDTWYPRLYPSVNGRDTGTSDEPALYNVSLALPSSFIVAASGKELSRSQEGEGWIRIDYEGELLRGFSLMVGSGWERLATTTSEVEI
ncbi:MAG: hypothetical protein ACETWC_03955, partial [Acidobacteriota bacterium]